MNNLYAGPDKHTSRKNKGGTSAALYNIKASINRRKCQRVEDGWMEKGQKRRNRRDVNPEKRGGDEICSSLSV